MRKLLSRNHAELLSCKTRNSEGAPHSTNGGASPMMQRTLARQLVEANPQQRQRTPEDFNEPALDRLANHALLPRQLRDLVPGAQDERKYAFEQIQNLQAELEKEREERAAAEADQPAAWNEERQRWQQQLTALKQHNQLVEGMYWNVRTKMEAIGGRTQNQRLQRGKVHALHAENKPAWGAAPGPPVPLTAGLALEDTLLGKSLRGEPEHGEHVDVQSEASTAPSASADDDAEPTESELGDDDASTVHVSPQPGRGGAFSTSDLPPRGALDGGAVVDVRP